MMNASLPNTIRITIEFTNLAKYIAGTPAIEVEFPRGITYGQIVEWLAERYPDMVGIIIQDDKKSLLNSNLFIINGEMAQPAFRMDDTPKDGDRLTLVAVATGG
ncbi:molybdopterin converting factor, small subunit [Bellilinea caldifistulae]|nr:MoaD/ThiS family protein [Bellilinea caldifistulae]GAP11538.1 molybdopterin converting factor, small subunit [Bellilinea caldifistulae]